MAKAKPVTDLNSWAPSGQNARSIVGTRLDEMYCWAAHVDNPYEVRGLHNLRIAAKRLRYTHWKSLKMSYPVLVDLLPMNCRRFRMNLA
jgi:hypothetical protein